MTREEAIRWLEIEKSIIKEVPEKPQGARELTEAYDMAIEALTVAVSREDTVTLNSPISIQAEMVAVVRCKDCRYFKKIVERSDSGLCHRDLVASAWKENSYCSRGERREP